MISRLILVALVTVTFAGCTELPEVLEADPVALAAVGQNETVEPTMRQSMEQAMEGAHDAHDQAGMERAHFAQGKGRIPSASDAADLPQVSSIRIIGDDGFRPAAGVSVGSGTIDDPFIIEGYYVAGDLYIQDTDACFVVRENYIGGQLSLNWNGICVHAHHNYINDLRVNENIRRDGYITGGLIEMNEIGFVGQLRHYDGIFQFNEVGPRPDSAPWDAVLESTPLLAPDQLVANIDGFNQGIIRNNKFVGSVDLDFHGHHHGTGFYAPHSHYHGDNESREMPHDHTQRWTSVQFTDNTIIDDVGYGLRYEDRNHAGDDQTAPSEQEDTLELAHVHRSMVDILRNDVQGAGIWVDVFNADDNLHKERNDGWVTIAGNKISLVERDNGPFGIWGSATADTGILVQTAKEVELVIKDNTLSYEASGDAGLLAPVVYPTAIAVERMGDSQITISGNDATGFHTGIRALRFDEAVAWSVFDNDLDATVQMDADDSVPMPEGK